MIWADAPVVVMERLPPPLEPPIVTAPVFEMVLLLELRLVTVRLGVAVNMGVPAEPILPVLA